MEYVEPVYNESFPNAAYVSDINYVSDSGTNDIQWTITMKNGDTIFLSTRLTIEKQPAVSYYAEDTPMETTEELNALLASIEEEASADTPVYLHLPAVTYDGDITFGDHVWSRDMMVTMQICQGLILKVRVESDWMRIVWYFLPIATSRVGIRLLLHRMVHGLMQWNVRSRIIRLV